MNILIAPNSMKGSVNAFDFANIVERAFIYNSGKHNILKIPVADGGDFTGEVLRRAFNASIINVEVRDPLGNNIHSNYSVFGKTAIIEMAEASGMKLIERNRLNPLKTNTYGTGQLIKDAINKGCSEIFLAIGGSATVDGGMGMMEALGFSFYDKDGNELVGNGLNISKVNAIQKPESLPGISIKIICDVDNPLLGKNGAAAVFGPQKGATPEMVGILENGLKNWAEIIQQKTDRKVHDIAGTGAAGGISVPLISFFNAEIVAGADFILKQLDFDTHVKWADVIITGEGKMDGQTLNNKAPFAVAKWAKKYNKVVFVLAGAVEKTSSNVFDGVFNINKDYYSKEFAIDNAKEILFDFSVEFAKSLKSKISKIRK